ncbi:5-(carboxyamino)imidazole ribonucleotide mutase [Caldicellulosiruptoraceae bacterium PP1]
MSKIAIVIGSSSDFPLITNGIKLLKEFNLEYDVRVLSAHRTPEQAVEFAKNAEKNGYEVIIAAAGKAAHLPGVLASNTLLPVIGVPIKSSTLDGMDALLSIVQMPKGIPVATVSIDGIDNAILLAIRILSIKYNELSNKLSKYVDRMKNEVLEQDKKISEEAKHI